MSLAASRPLDGFWKTQRFLNTKNLNTCAIPSDVENVMAFKENIIVGNGLETEIKVLGPEEMMVV